ncbi:MAG: efflux RND transporter permease subunit [Planctomycetes bacterium]|mgnify:FL=1|nr:efflux RND transporter permease subunit [Planctomycetota bacterium]MBT7639522.1 efflux RND transporter permease subunit [Planctomycetota bacterium]
MSRPIALCMITSAIVVFGIVSLMRLPIELLPEVDRPTITVRTELQGAAPEEVEERVARRLEKTLSVVSGLRRISSLSRIGTCDVILEFSWGQDLAEAIQDIREKLDQANLPERAESPSILRYDPRLDPVLLFGLSGSADMGRLRVLAEEEVERRLETVPGVAAVRVRGGLEEEILVEVSEERVRNRGLSIELISRRLAEENFDQASGLLEDGDVDYILRVRNEVVDSDDILSIPLLREGLSVVRLGDVADVRRSFQEDRVITRIDGQPAVFVEVLKEGDANIISVSKRVRERVFGTAEEQRQLQLWQEKRAGEKVAEESRGGFSFGQQGGGAIRRPDYVASWLPPGTNIDLLSDQADFIEGSIDDLRQTALVGGLLAMLVLYLFLGKLSTTLVVAIAIPCSIVVTFVPLYISDTSLNIMSLGGLALGIGLLVDSSIVVLESIFRKQKETGDPIRGAVEGAAEVAGAVTASTLTTVAVFFPIVFVEGLAGQVFGDMAVAVVGSLLAALVVSLTLVPMLAARAPAIRKEMLIESVEQLPQLGENQKKKKKINFFSLMGPALWLHNRVELLLLGVGSIMISVAQLILLVALRIFFSIAKRSRHLAGGPLRVASRIIQHTETIYLRWIRSALDHRVSILIMALVAVVVAGLLIPQLGSELIPRVARGEIEVQISLPVGTPLDVTDERVRQLERSIATLPGVDRVVARIGRDSDDVEASAEGEHTARIELVLAVDGTDVATAEKLLIDSIAPLADALPDALIHVKRPHLFSMSAPLEVEVRGPDSAELEQIEREITERLVASRLVSEVQPSTAPGSPEYHLRPDRERLARLGISTREIADALQNKNVGTVATRLRRQERQIDVRVRLRKEDRSSIGEILATGVAVGPSGRSIPLEELLESWTIEEGPSEILRIGRQRAKVVSAQMAGFDLGRVAEMIEAELNSELDLPEDVVVEVVGQKKEMERSLESLIAALALAVFLVYVVMASQFESLLQPLVILLSIPLSVVGVVPILWLTGTPISVMTSIGMIVLAGIVVNNAIVLLDQVNRLRSDGMTMNDALIEGGRKRLRPILMTTLTTVLALIPVTGVLSRLPGTEHLTMILGSGEGSEIRAPLALTVIGGLMASTLLTLLVVPVFASLVDIGSRSSETQQ